MREIPTWHCINVEQLRNFIIIFCFTTFVTGTLKLNLGPFKKKSNDRNGNENSTIMEME